MRTGDRITRSSVGGGGVELSDSTPGREWRVVRCGVAATMLGRHWNKWHSSPSNSRPSLLALRNRVAWRYFRRGDGATPPPNEFDGVQAPAVQCYAVEGWLLRNRPIDVR